MRKHSGSPWFMPRVGLVAAALLACEPRACRREDPITTSEVDTGQFGGPGAGYTAQCSGWFPDWISSNPPAAGTSSFQLSQGYPLGVPILEVTEDDQLRIARWDPFGPSTSTVESPWLAHDFHIAAQQPAYLNALKDYLLAGNVEVSFEAQKNTHRSWFHVPMMTTDPNSRREPYHGVTKERALRANDHRWIVDGAANNLDSYAIGYYNWLGGYTIGQVFGDPDPQLSSPPNARFIPGAFVFKLLFAEYDTTKIDPAQDPLVDAPEWQVLDVQAPTAPLSHVRLIQVDVAVRDDRAAETGWVFATFVYDKSMTSETNPWRRLRPVGLQWGNDPDVTASGVGTVDQSWLAAGIPAALQRQDGRPFGRHGRLNGPVDNPDSSCISCHSTAQVVTSATALGAFRGVDLFPAAACTDTQDMSWFRNIAAGTPFGVMTNGGDGCDLAAPATATPPLHSVDYSLQLADALEASLFFDNPNPCAGMVADLRDVSSPIALPGDQATRRAAAGQMRERMAPTNLRDLSRQRMRELPVVVDRKVRIEPKRMAIPAGKEPGLYKGKALEGSHRR